MLESRPYQDEALQAIEAEWAKGNTRTAVVLPTGMGKTIVFARLTKDRASLAHFLDALSAVAALRGEAKRSALLIGAAEESLREVGAPVYNFYAPDPSLKERATAEARASLGEAAFEELRERGRATTFEEAVRLGTASALGAVGGYGGPPQP